MIPILWILIDLLSRYLHIVCATLLVGGTLFYEMVVPIAIDELSTPQQLLVIARARWVFKWIVWLSTATIVISGIISTTNHWKQYNSEPERIYRLDQPPRMGAAPEAAVKVPPAGRAGWWWAAHASTGLVAVLIALSLTIGKVPPSQPIRWMRLNLVILLLVMFLATATRHARLQSDQRRVVPSEPPEMREF
jgi:peptidoglycan/LPS O-acetylase OafA/YrhL